MIGCLVLAFQLCNPNTPYGGYGYVQQPQVVYAQPQVYYQPPPQIVYAQPVYIAQPQYYGGYGGGYPFGGNGIGVRVGPRGGVSVRCC